MKNKKDSKFSRIMGIIMIGFMSFVFLMIVGNSLLYAVDKLYIYLICTENSLRGYMFRNEILVYIKLYLGQRELNFYWLSLFIG